MRDYLLGTIASFQIWSRALTNEEVTFLGYRPKDNAEIFSSKILSTAPPANSTDLAQTRVGGPFAAVPLGESGLANMTIIDDRKKN